MDDLEFEVDLFAGMVRGRMVREPGYTAVQVIPGIGPTLGAVFVAEIGDITRFASAPKLTCWAGLTPKHHESDTHVHRGRITKQGSRLVRWAAIESVKNIPARSVAGVLRERVATAAAATSVPWPRPDASWSSSSTPCATVTFAP
jgi:transposase